MRMIQGRSLCPSISGARPRTSRAMASALSAVMSSSAIAALPARSIHRHGDKAHFAFAVGDEQKRRFPRVLLRAVDRPGDVAWMFDRLMIDLLDDVARPQAPFRGGRTGVDGRHDHALDAVLDVEGLARVRAQTGKLHAQRLSYGVQLERVVALGGERGLLFYVFEPPQHHG